MDFLTIYEFVGVLLTAAVAILAFVCSSRTKKRTNTAAVALFGVILTLLVSLRYDVLPAIRDHLALAGSVRGVQRAETLINGVLSASCVVRASMEPLMDEFFTRRLDSLDQQMQEMSQGVFTIEEHEMPEVARKLILRAMVSFEATSYVTVDEWWGTTWGREYEQLNIRAVERGVNVERIFIFANQHDFERAKPYMKRQADNGIKVSYVFSSELDRKVTADMVVIDGELAGKLELTPEKGMKEAKFYTNDRDVSAIGRLIARLGQNAQVYKRSSP